MPLFIDLDKDILSAGNIYKVLALALGGVAIARVSRSSIIRYIVELLI